jgi:hypothetical protein
MWTSVGEGWGRRDMSSTMWLWSWRLGVGWQCNGQCCWGKAVGGVGHAMDDALVGRGIGGWLAEGQDVGRGPTQFGENAALWCDRRVRGCGIADALKGTGRRD